MSKFVVFLKNSILLVLLVLPFLAQFNLQSNNLTQLSLLETAASCFVASKTCEDSGGFVGDTLVKTATGYEKISDLKVGSIVMTLDQAMGNLCEQPVTAVASVIVRKTVWLTLGDEQNTMLCTGTKQTFCGFNPLAEVFNLQKHIWLKPPALTSFAVVAGGDFVVVGKVEASFGLVKLHLIEVANTHNFLVTKADILVHNNPLALPAIAEITAETAMLVAAGTKMVVDAVVGKAEQASLNDDRPEGTGQEKPKAVEEEINTTSAGGPPGGPGKPPKKDDGNKRDKEAGGNKDCHDNKVCNQTTTGTGPGKPPTKNKKDVGWSERAVKTGVAVAVSAETRAWYKEVKSNDKDRALEKVEQENKNLQNDKVDLINAKISLVNDKVSLTSELMKLRQEKEASTRRIAAAGQKNKINKQKLIEKDKEIIALRQELKQAYALRNNPPE